MFEASSFFTAVIGAGAILSGFCGTFLSFRIQREASYYRQPALDYKRGKARDIGLDLTHFTASFLLILLSTSLCLTFGFVFPLLALAGINWIAKRPGLVVGGLISAVVLLLSYFLAELIHYNIIKGRLVNDPIEWGREAPLVVAAIVVAVACFLLSCWLI